jgi:GDPmannose 4,6-dehydratase
MKKALICGVTGQDGGYLAQFLLGKGYEVWGTSRDAELANYSNVLRLGIREDIKMLSMIQSDFRSVLNALAAAQPDEVYCLSGQSSVALSFDRPVETMESICTGVLNLLEAVRYLDKEIKIYHASSSECFGEIEPGSPANEETPFQPRSPYGVAKASAHLLIKNYRNAYNLFCCNGILFNHESPLRSKRFVTHKIISTACRIKQGSKERLKLGRLDVSRDWGFAPDFVEAMWLMLQHPEPDDYVIATGKAHTLETFVSRVFEELDLDWKEYVDTDEQLFRPLDIKHSLGNPQKSYEVLKWKPKTMFPELIHRLVKEEMTASQF